MSCKHYPIFRAALEARAREARALGSSPERYPAFQQALALARYHRENCVDCDAEFMAAFPELATLPAHNQILSHKVVEEEI